MATLDERFNSLADDYETFAQQVVAKLDEHAATQRAQGRDIREIKTRIATVDTRLGTVDSRLNGLDDKVDALSEDVGSLRVEINQKFEQVIALLTQDK